MVSHCVFCPAHVEPLPKAGLDLLLSRQVFGESDIIWDPQQRGFNPHSTKLRNNRMDTIFILLVNASDAAVIFRSLTHNA
jgi:hypothetical protein